MTDENTTPPSIDRLGTSRKDFFTAVATLVSEANQLLWFSDYDFADWNFDSEDLTSGLNTFLRSSDTAQLQLLLGNPQHLAAQAPRFARLRQRLGHRIECRQAPPEARFSPGIEGLVIADARHLLRRSAPPAYKCRLILDAPEQTERLLSNYRYLWNNSLPCLPGTPLGL